MKFCERKKLVDRESFVAQYVCLAVASMGLTVLLGSDDLLAAFACGTVFAWDGWFQKKTADSHFSSIVDLIFNVATFVYIGAEMPWQRFVDSSINLSVGRLIGLSLLVLILKRIPIVIALWHWIPDIKTFREALFSGYFGPMGVGAIFMCTFARLMLPEDVPEPLETPNQVLAATIQPIVYFFVLSSVIVHGLTIPFFAFGQHAHTNLHRTLSIHYTMRQQTGDSFWASKIRRFNTSASPADSTDGEPGQMSVVEAMRAGLAKQLASNSNAETAESTGSASDQDEQTNHRHRSRQPLTHFQTIDDVEDGNYAVGDDDWDGEDTAEVRRQKMSEKKNREEGEMHEKDITDAEYPAGEEAKGKHAEHAPAKESGSSDSEYPIVREWIEGHDIIVEAQENEYDEPLTTVVPMSKEEYDVVKDTQSPVRTLLTKYEDKLSENWDKSKHQGLFKAGSQQLYKHGVPQQLSKWQHERRPSLFNLASQRSPKSGKAGLNQGSQDEENVPEVVIVKPDGTIIE